MTAIDGKNAPKADFAAAEKVWNRKNCLVIAEIGTGHGGDRQKAFDLIDAAGESGADCVKFQLVYADEIIHPETGIVPLPGGDIRLYDSFKALELPFDFYRGLKERAEKRGLIFLCTPFGARSAGELASIQPALMKVASPELNHLPLLRQIAETGIPTLLSCGVSTLSDIEKACRCFSSPVAILHCVTSYPAPEEEYNLRILRSLSSVFGLPAGVSDHSLDPRLVPTLSLACGGCAVEKHFCLSRKDGGLDDLIALTPGDFKAMVQSIRRAQTLGDQEIIRWMGSEYGAERVEAVLGDGVKRLAKSEDANYGRSNRSLHALRAITSGEALGQDNLAILRTEKILRPGLHPEFFELACSRLAARDIPSGEGVVWDDLGSRKP
jgi:sialic acid synthase SpsE